MPADGWAKCAAVCRRSISCICKRSCICCRGSSKPAAIRSHGRSLRKWALRSEISRSCARIKCMTTALRRRGWRWISTSRCWPIQLRQTGSVIRWMRWRCCKQGRIRPSSGGSSRRLSGRTRRWRSNRRANEKAAVSGDATLRWPAVGLRSVLETPVAELSQEAVLERQRILAAFPDYQAMLDAGHQAHDQLVAGPVFASTPTESKSLSALFDTWERSASDGSSC